EAVGRLKIIVPTGVRDQAALAKSLQGIQREVAESGIDYRIVYGGLQGGRRGTGSGDTPTINLTYQRPLAVPPPCHDWTGAGGRPRPRGPAPPQQLRAGPATRPRAAARRGGGAPGGGGRGSMGGRPGGGGARAGGSDPPPADTAARASSAKR